MGAACSEVDGARSRAPAYGQPSAGLAGERINSLHRPPELLRRDPVRRILEARDIKDEGEVTTHMIAAYRRKVAAPGLSHRAAVVGCDNDGAAAGGRRERGSPRLKARHVASTDFDIRAVAACEACKLIDVHATFAHVREGDAAVEHLLGEPSPRPFPLTPRVDGKRIQRNDQGSRSAEGRFRLRVKLLREWEVSIQAVCRERLGEHAPAFGR